ncbi:uncharacterized protein LOC121597434 [Anopheles merus]|uniref:uncharacterized protein LOC121597434 n=1 Tax=Anopheles merus TaxID=30066 RepID=UPI001BE48C37|nr:uncharacterized protein LOC121597434 [Anopheles merus]
MHAFQTLDNVFMFRKEKCKECMKQPIASLGLQESGYSYFISSMCKRCRWFGDRMLCQEQGKCEKRANELHADEAVSIASRKKGCDVSTSQRSGFPQQMSAVRQ